jgi:AraC-like DNA-binding protein
MSDPPSDVLGSYVAALRAFPARGGTSRMRATSWTVLERESGSAVGDVLARSIEVSGDPACGLRFARDFDLGRFGLLGVVAAMADDIGGALTTFAQCRAAMSSLGGIRVQADSRWVDIVWQPAAGTSPQVSEMVMAGWLHFARRISAEPLQVERVAFAHAPLARTAAVEALLDAPVQTAASCNALRLRRDALATPLRCADRDLFAALLPWLQRQAALLQTDRSGRMAAIQRTMVGLWREEGAVYGPTLAQRLGWSARTFQRRLSDEHGVRFRELCDTLRVAAAVHALVQQPARQVDIACELGFAEQSSFSRAMREWTGVPPSALHGWAKRAAACM